MVLVPNHIDLASNLDFINEIKIGAGDGVRTRDINLGKVALYQLSHSRVN